MESAAVLRSFHCSVSPVAHAQSTIEKAGVISMRNVMLSHGLSGSGRLFFSSGTKKRVFLPFVKASGTTLAATPDGTSLDSNSRGTSEKENTTVPNFPSGFEELILEVCDETEIAELKLKIGNFEMNLKRNIEATVSLPMASYSAPAVVPSKPAAEPAPASSPPPLSASKSSPEKTSPFKNVSSEKSSKLAALESSGATGYVIVSSPSVGTFLSGRTLKGKKQPPICKVGDVIKEGQIIGYLDQFGSELPLRSDAAGEVLKMLYSDGEAIGYGDPLIALLPSFKGIK